MKKIIGQRESNRKHQEKRRRQAGVPTREQIYNDNLLNFMSKSTKIHNGIYNYSKVKYHNCTTKIEIGCAVHGMFWQIPHAHQYGQGCPVCALTIKHNSFRKNADQFILEANNKHQNKYDYSQMKYINNKTKIVIICPIHNTFEQRAGVHLRGQGCPCCGAENRIAGRTSKGELKIETFLKENNIVHVKHKTFKNCIFIRPLSYDFYIQSKNILIEFDGEQHFRFIKHFHGTEQGFKIQQKRDLLKTDYAYNNKIKLIRIRWDEINNIPVILSTIFVKQIG